MGHAMAQQTGDLLRDIHQYALQAGLPPITALIVRKSGAGMDLPGKGFWDLQGESALSIQEKRVRHTELLDLCWSRFDPGTIAEQSQDTVSWTDILELNLKLVEQAKGHPAGRLQCIHMGSARQSGKTTALAKYLKDNPDAIMTFRHNTSMNAFLDRFGKDLKPRCFARSNKNITMGEQFKRANDLGNVNVVIHDDYGNDYIAPYLKKIEDKAELVIVVHE